MQICSYKHSSVYTLITTEKFIIIIQSYYLLVITLVLNFLLLFWILLIYEFLLRIWEHSWACLDCLFKVVFLPREHQWQVLFLEIVIYVYLDNEIFPLIRFYVSCNSYCWFKCHIRDVIGNDSVFFVVVGLAFKSVIGRQAVASAAK